MTILVSIFVAIILFVVSCVLAASTFTLSLWLASWVCKKLGVDEVDEDDEDDEVIA